MRDCVQQTSQSGRSLMVGLNYFSLDDPRHVPEPILRQSTAFHRHLERPTIVLGWNCRGFRPGDTSACSCHTAAMTLMLPLAELRSAISKISSGEIIYVKLTLQADKTNWASSAHNWTVTPGISVLCRPDYLR